MYLLETVTFSYMTTILFSYPRNLTLILSIYKFSQMSEILLWILIPELLSKTTLSTINLELFTFSAFYGLS